MASTISPHRAITWHQSMIRVRDPVKSLHFYQDLLGFTLVDRVDFPEQKFSVYYLQTLSPSQKYSLTPGSNEAHEYLFNTDAVTVELTHNHGTEKEEGFEGYHPGNHDNDGFGHLAVSCQDVYAAAKDLEEQGVSFKKRPDEGRMKGLAFALDPDGYWIEIVSRGGDNTNVRRFSLAQTMLRVKDPLPSVEFYTKHLNMTQVNVRHFSDFSLYFLASLPESMLAKVPQDLSSPEASSFVKETLYPNNIPVLELTHNHGTENQDSFKYDNGNTDGRRGFGHIGFLVDDLNNTCERLLNDNVEFKKKPEEGRMRNIAFALDPDGYWVELIQKGFKP